MTNMVNNIKSDNKSARITRIEGSTNGQDRSETAFPASVKCALPFKIPGKPGILILSRRFSQDRTSGEGRDHQRISRIYRTAFRRVSHQSLYQYDT